jgi:hypothetical protein
MPIEPDPNQLRRRGRRHPARPAAGAAPRARAGGGGAARPAAAATPAARGSAARAEQLAALLRRIDEVRALSNLPPLDIADPSLEAVVEAAGASPPRSSATAGA